MNIYYGILLSGAIIFLWVIVGGYEWKLPWKIRMKVHGLICQTQDKEKNEALFCLIPAKKIANEDTEKEIYIIKKARKPKGCSIIMNVIINKEERELKEKDKERIKVRLEKRFPGITVHFITEG